MTISIKLIDTVSSITTKINIAIAEEMNKKMMGARAQLKNKLHSMIGMWIRSQPEMLSLHDAGVDSLAAHFGLPFGSADNAVNHIVSSIQSSVDVRFVKFGPKLTGGITLGIQPDNMANLLSLKKGHVITAKGSDLHWLSWLLERGQGVIVIGYNYTPDTAPRGRSGGGTMGRGTAWRVPPQYAGTINDNFVTRAFDGREKDIARLFSDILRTK